MIDVKKYYEAQKKACEKKGSQCSLLRVDGAIVVDTRYSVKIKGIP